MKMRQRRRQRSYMSRQHAYGREVWQNIDDVMADMRRIVREARHASAALMGVSFGR